MQHSNHQQKPKSDTCYQWNDFLFQSKTPPVQITTPVTSGTPAVVFRSRQAGSNHYCSVPITTTGAVARLFTAQRCFRASPLHPYKGRNPTRPETDFYKNLVTTKCINYIRNIKKLKGGFYEIQKA